MSHIDSFKHQFVGKFGYLPVYRAEEEINGDFYCRKGHLIFGGGSGEHPALVIKDPTACVARYLDNEIGDFDVTDKDKKEWRAIYDQYLNWDDEEILAYYEWGVERYSNFYSMCKEESMPNPYQSDKESFESWLICGVGEFIFFSMPELADEITDKLKGAYQYFRHMSYNNILLYPPNIPVYSSGGNAFVQKAKKIT